MYNKELVLDCLANIEEALDRIVSRFSMIHSADDFLLSSDGLLRLDAICMNLIALGEAVKGLDKITKGELLSLYPEVYWSGVMKMRDKIAHHYFEIDADVVYVTLQEDIPAIIPVIQRMKNELK